MTQAASHSLLIETVRRVSFNATLTILALGSGLQAWPAAATPQKLVSQKVTQQTSEASQSSKPRTGLPGRRVAGGSRSSCQRGEMPLASIVPTSNLSVTAAAHPKLLFYVAEAATTRTAEFVLRDAQDREVYSSFMKVPAQAGFVTVDLAKNDPELRLEQDENYQWYFSILCQPGNRAADLGVEGWLRPVALSSQTQTAEAAASSNAQDMATLPPLERVQTLLTLDLWHDAMVSLSELQLNPALSVGDRQQAQQLWQKLLSADPHLAGLMDQQVEFLAIEVTAEES